MIILFLILASFLNASLHVIGDSHVRAFQGIPGCNIHELGPVLMHRVGRDGLNAINLKNFQVEEGSAVIYVFGEIDVRCHILKQRDLKNRNADEIVDTLAKNYVRTVLNNQAQYNQLISIVYNIVPPEKSGVFNPDYPFYGTIEERIGIAQRLNRALESLCNEADILFLDLYDAYSNEDGSLCAEFSDGNVHIDAKYNIPIQQRLNELIPFKFP